MASSAGSSPSRRSADAREVRLEWRPSRWLLAALVVLCAMALVSLGLSEAPAVMSWPIAAGVLVHGALAIRRDQRRAPHALAIRDDGTGTVDGQGVDAVRVAWRGPLAFVSWREASGRRRRLSWWPDTLPPSLRRELRLAAPAAGAAGRAGSMAP